MVEAIASMLDSHVAEPGNSVEWLKINLSYLEVKCDMNVEYI